MKRHYKDQLYADLTASELHEEAKTFIQRAAQVGPNAARKEFDAEARSMRDAELIKAAEQRLEKTLAACGGDTDKALHVLALNLEVILAQRADERAIELEAKKGKPGRRSDVWGPGGCGKFVVKVLVDQEKKKMQAEGTVKPKIRDAIARCFGISRDKPASESTIADYASRCSEANKMLRKQNKNSKT